MKSVWNIHWKDWCWSWNSNTLSTWCEELTHLKRPWCWERLKAEGEGDNRGCGWMASLTQWTWVWVNSGSWWWTGRPGMLQSMGSQRVRHDWATELNWTVKLKTHYVLQYSQLLLSATMLDFFPPAFYYSYSSVAHLELEFIIRKEHSPFDGKTCSRKYMPQKQALNITVETRSIDWHFLSIMG